MIDSWCVDSKFVELTPNDLHLDHSIPADVIPIQSSCDRYVISSFATFQVELNSHNLGWKKHMFLRLAQFYTQSPTKSPSDASGLDNAHVMCFAAVGIVQNMNLFQPKPWVVKRGQNQ